MNNNFSALTDDKIRYQQTRLWKKTHNKMAEISEETGKPLVLIAEQAIFDLWQKTFESQDNG